MSSEQITQETVPVEKTQPSTETVKPTTQETKQEATTSTTQSTTQSTWKDSISEEYRKELVNYGVNLLDNPIVIDNNLITSNGPSTAVDVAFVLLEALTSKENTLKVRNLMGFFDKFRKYY